MQIVFYCLYGFFGLLGIYFVGSSLLGRFTLAAGMPEAIAQLLLLAGAVAGGYWMHQAYLIGEKEKRYGAGAGLVLLALLCCQGLPTVGALLFKLFVSKR